MSGLDEEHYELTLSEGGGTTSQCACGQIFSLSSDLQNHIGWELKKLEVQLRVNTKPKQPIKRRGKGK